MVTTEKAIRQRQMRDAAASIDRSLSTRRVDAYLSYRSRNLWVSRTAAAPGLGPLFDIPDLSPDSAFSKTDKIGAIVQTLTDQIFPSLSEAWMGQ